MKIKLSEKRMYLQYITEDNDKICRVFKSPQSADEFINKNKQYKITYYSDKRFPFKDHYSAEEINNMIGYFGSNRTTKRFKEVK